MAAAKILEATIGEGGRLELVVPESKPGERVRVTVEKVQEAQRLPRIGFAKDVILYIADDFDAPLEDFKDYM